MTERMFIIVSVCLLCLGAIACQHLLNVNIEAEPGDNVTLFSTFDQNWTSFECRRDTSTVVLFRNNKTMPHCCPEYEGRVSVSTVGNLSVVLTNVTYNDPGVYTCDLLDSQDKAKPLRVFSLILTVSEHVVIYAKPGDNVTLFSTPDLNLTSFKCNKNKTDCGPEFKGGAGHPLWISLMFVALGIFAVSCVVFGVVHRKKITECFRKEKPEPPQTGPTVQYRAVSNGLPDSVTVHTGGGDLAQNAALATSTPLLSG